MEEHHSELDVYVMETYKNAISKAAVFDLVSDIMITVLGTVFLLYSIYKENMLSSVFFTLSVILGFFSLECDKWSRHAIKSIAQDYYVNKKPIHVYHNTLTKYTTAAHILNIISGIFGLFGLLFVVF